MIKYICALITVSDIERSKRFYTEVLGQKIMMDHGENVAFEGGFAIHLNPHFQKLLDIAPAPLQENRTPDHELYFESSDLETLQAKLTDERVTFLHPLREQPWGQRVMRFYDPDHHVVEIGESMESVILRYHASGLSIEEIHRKTSMPIQYITTTLQKGTLP